MGKNVIIAALPGLIEEQRSLPLKGLAKNKFSLAGKFWYLVLGHVYLSEKQKSITVKISQPCQAIDIFKPSSVQHKNKPFSTSGRGGRVKNYSAEKCC